jgi:hypothetical protein
MPLFYKAIVADVSDAAAAVRVVVPLDSEPDEEVSDEVLTDTLAAFRLNEVV